MSTYPCMVMVLLSLSAIGQSGESEKAPFEDIQPAERDVAKTVCRGILDALGRPEGMDEEAVLNRFVRIDEEGHVWYVCLPKECDDTILTDVAALANLTYLEAGDTKITDAGAKELAVLKSLEILHLWNTTLTDTGLGSLKELNGLQLLNLGGTSVSDTGIAQLVDLESLEQLRLNGTEVTDNVVEHLKKLPKLQKVWLQDTEVTSEAVDQLRQAFTKEEPFGAKTRIMRTQITIFHNANSRDESRSDSGTGGERTP